MVTKKTIAKKTANNKAAAKSAITKAKHTDINEPKVILFAKEGTSKVLGAGAKEAGGFITFVREQGVVGLAVGLAIGTAAGATVKTIVDQFIGPIVSIITQGVKLTELKWVIYPATAARDEVALGWGAILSSLITLIATAFVIYQLVHVAKLDKLDKKKA
ncbi:MscL family protein [Candidatus Saccharibacteria bacterium]|nr:MscL family protein [Candidatus Saccharibacteria bacterium]